MEDLGPEAAGELLTLQRAAYVGESLIYGQFLPPLRETLDEVRAALADPDVTVLGIRDDGRLIGTARVKRDGEIARIAVAPDRQHEGLGRRLLEAAIERGGRGCSPATAASATCTCTAATGFEETHRVPVPGHTLVYLRRPGA